MITRHAPGDFIGRHRHIDGYAAIVVAGGYVEAGRGARMAVAPGDVIVHDAFDAHQDHISRRGAVVLNLPVLPGVKLGNGRIDDVDTVVAVAERDEPAAAEILRYALRPIDVGLNDWVDLLAKELVIDEDAESLAYWADRFNIRPQSLSRGFAAAFGVTPKRYRLEQRALRAITALRSGSRSISALAAETGFADQAHMTRAVVALTGEPPTRHRCSSFKTIAGRTDEDG